MSYAVRNDGQGWRAVSGPDDVGLDEWHSTDQPPDPVPLPLTEEALVVAERSYRDQELTGVAWLRDRHRDQLEIEVTTTLSTDQFRALLVYMQALRDWPQSPEFPESERRPIAPPWIAAQAK